jgi:predicted phage terminase large subunit-like protein
MRWARPEQLAPPGDWRVWLILAGRGFGKTRAGAEWVIDRARRGYRSIALIGETVADVREVMIEGEGESGILECSPPWFRPVYEPSLRQLTWPNGCVAHTYSGDTPRQLRGPAHDSAWADEPAKWQYPVEAWDMMEMGLRAGPDPRVVATTTPTPIPLIRSLIEQSRQENPSCVITRGNTFENEANLAPSFLARLRERYVGTRLGRQELFAEILDDNPDALWSSALLESTRVRKAPQLQRIVVGVDPAVTCGEDSNETGIIVAGLGVDGHGYVLDDRTLRAKPVEWATAAVLAYDDWRADRLIAEVNNGGDLVEAVVRTVAPRVSYKAVRAARGKLTRAEPVAALFEQGRCHMVGHWARLESQLTDWVPGMESPDRLDAMVWAFTELLLGGSGATAYGF